MADNDKYKRFEVLNFDDFKKLAKDESLSMYEKIGFENDYRQGYEEAIFNDIKSKIFNADPANLKGKTYLDIGPGCTELPNMLINFATQNAMNVVLADSKEMLDLLPSGDTIKKVEGYFPNIDNLEASLGKADFIVTYSVFHYIVFSSCMFTFIDAALSLLNHGGYFLIGDIPNFAKRKRFFSSPQGIAYHQNFTKTNTLPSVEFNTLDHGKIDDGILLAIFSRYRAAGFDVYILPQAPNLPMANRREDILIYKP